MSYGLISTKAVMVTVIGQRKGKGEGRAKRSTGKYIFLSTVFGSA